MRSHGIIFVRVALLAALLIALPLASPGVAAPATGWVGETVANATANDWEPAVATDPGAPYVYTLVTRYGGPDACPSNCPDPAIILRVSSDGGKTWGSDRFLCVCRRFGGQFDPQVEVVTNTGAV